MKLLILAIAFSLAGCAAHQAEQAYQVGLVPDKCDPGGDCNVGKKP